MRTLLSTLALLALVQPLRATYGQEDPRLARLYGSFMSPCCWQQNLTIHDSPVANQLRAQIQQMVREGRTDEEIKSTMIQVHSKRILAIPEGAERVWLFLTPWFAGAVGLLALVWVIRRFRATVPNAALAGVVPAEVDEEWLEN